MKKIFLKISLAIFVFGLFFVSSSNNVLAADATSTSIEFANPLEKNTVDEILTLILNKLQGVIVVISMIFIVLGALLYIFSSGDEGKMKTAKGAIYAAVIGLAIGVAAPSFLKEIYDALGKTSSDSTVTSAASLSTIALNVLNFLLGIVGTAAIIMLVAAGIAYLSASGNEGQIETAKKMTKWSIVGIAVALGALVIVQQVSNFFS